MDTPYTHTQKAPLAYLLAAVSMVSLVAAFTARDGWLVTVVLTAAAGVTLVFALAFRSLTVSDEGDRLAIRFGTDDVDNLVAFLRAKTDTVTTE